MFASKRNHCCGNAREKLGEQIAKAKTFISCTSNVQKVMFQAIGWTLVTGYRKVFNQILFCSYICNFIHP